MLVLNMRHTYKRINTRCSWWLSAIKSLCISTFTWVFVSWSRKRRRIIAEFYVNWKLCMINCNFLISRCWWSIWNEISCMSSSWNFQILIIFSAHNISITMWRRTAKNLSISRKNERLFSMIEKKSCMQTSNMTSENCETNSHSNTILMKW